MTYISIMDRSPPRIFDRATYRARRAGAAHAHEDPILVADTASQLAFRIAAINRQFQRGLDLSSRPEAFSVVQPLAHSWIRTAARADSGGVIADEEWLPFAEES